jgi:hypothetical protein
MRKKRIFDQIPIRYFFFDLYKGHSGARRSLSPTENVSFFFVFPFFGGTTSACLDPDLDSQFGSADPFESVSNPDQKHKTLLKGLVFLYR